MIRMVISGFRKNLQMLFRYEPSNTLDIYSTIMSELQNLVDDLLVAHPVINSTNYRLYAEIEAHKFPQFTADEIAQVLLKSVAKKQKDASVLDEPVKRVIVHSQAKPIHRTLEVVDRGLNRRQLDRKMTLIRQMSDIIKQAGRKGIAKTAIFTELRKENSHWRDELTTWLDELVVNGHVVQERRRYFDCDVVIESRERMLHRLIWEALEDRPLSMSKIAIVIGYGGGRRRPLVKEAIDEMERDGFLKREGIKWRWAK